MTTVERSGNAASMRLEQDAEPISIEVLPDRRTDAQLRFEAAP